MSEIKPVSIKTWQEVSKQFAQDRRAMTTNQMIWMQQEIDELRAALEALQETNAAQAKRIAELELSNTVHELSRGTTKEEMIKKIAFLQNQAEEMLAAMRRAVLALAFAAEKSRAMQDDYQALSNAIDKAVSAQKGTEHGTS